MGMMNNGRKLSAKEVATMVAAMGLTQTFLKPSEETKTETKPEFTPEELELIRSLPKAEKKRKVAELKAAYARKAKP